MSKQTTRQTNRAIRSAICESLEGRRMLYVHYPGSPSWGFSNITYSYTNALDGGLMGVTPTAVSDATNDALSMWAAVIPRTFTRVADPDPNMTTDETYDASGWPIIRIGQHTIDGSGGTLAHAYRPGTNGQNGDLHFDISEQWTINPSVLTADYDVLETVLHELGHTLGLDHQPAPPGGVQAVMNPSYAERFSGPGTGFLLQDDINGVQALYGAGLGYALDIDGTMYVSGTSGANTITVSWDQGAGTFTVNSAGFGSFTRSTSGVTKLVIRGGPGSDLIIVNEVPFAVDVRGGGFDTDTLRIVGGNGANGYTLNAFNEIVGGSYTVSYNNIETIEVLGGSATDTFTVSGAPSIPVLLNGKFGNDIFNINAMSNSLTLEGDFGNDTFNINCTGSTTAAIMRGGFDQDTFNYQEINIATTADGGDGNDTFNIAVNGGFEKIRGNVLLNGDAGDDVANLATNAPASVRVIISPVTLNGGTGQDTVNVGGGWLDAVQSATTFSGGNDGLDRAVLNDSAVSAPYSYNATSTTLTRDAFFGGLTFFGTQKVIVECTQGDNTVTIANGIATSIDVRGNNGNDSFVTGGGLLQGSAGHPLNGGSGIDNITFDDRLDATNRTWQMLPELVNFAGTFISTVGFESVSVLAGTGSDSIVFAMGEYTQILTVDGGGGQDQFSAPAVEITSLTLRGGNDAVSDFLDIDDRNLAANLIGGSIYADRISRDIPGQVSDIYYSGFTSINWYQQAHQNVIAVYGTPSDIGSNFQFSIIGNSQDDYMEVYTRDALGNPTINGNLYFIGNGDVDQLSVFSGNGPANLSFFQPGFASSSSYLSGAGTGWISGATTVENINVYGSPANDTFAVDSFKSGSALAIFGGSGNDNCTIGGGDMSVNLTSASYFAFDGQAGSDRFTIANGVTNTPWTYQVNTDSVVSSKPSAGYSWTSIVQNIESQYVFAGSAADTFNIDGTAPGVYTEFNGFGGVDELRAGTANLAVNNIRGSISYNAGADGGTLLISNAGGFVSTAHQDANTIGAYAGDNLFGAGGSLTFSGVTDNGGISGIGIILRSNSTLYAQPLAAARVSTSTGLIFDPPSGSLRLATAGLTNPVINGTAASGNLTSANRQTLSWFNYAGSIQTDAVAPAVVNADINVNGAPGFADAINPQSVDVQFSENVSGQLSPSWLLLTNTTLGQSVPTANIAVSYDTGTNLARFTFPGYVNGILPDGNYSGKILAGLPDFFGNALPADANFSFFFLNGDATRDRAVNSADFNVLATNFGSSNRTFTQGNFNYDPAGAVNSADFNILASQFGKTLPGSGESARGSTSPAGGPGGAAAGLGGSSGLFGDSRIGGDDEPTFA